MTMTAIYTSEGMLVSVHGGSEGTTVLIPHHWTVAAIENNLRELVEWVS